MSGYDERRCWGFGRPAITMPTAVVLHAHVLLAQAAAIDRVSGKDGIHKAAERGDIAAVQDYLIADASCVHFYRYDCTPPCLCYT
jgi:hypothetical protein